MQLLPDESKGLLAKKLAIPAGVVRSTLTRRVRFLDTRLPQMLVVRGRLSD